MPGPLYFVRIMVRPRGFEPLAYSFGGCRSIQLSYGRVFLSLHGGEAPQGLRAVFRAV